MMSQITSNWRVCSIICSGWYQRRYQNITLLALCEGNPPVTGGFPSQMASNTEIFLLLRRHHDMNFPHSLSWIRCHQYHISSPKPGQTNGRSVDVLFHLVGKKLSITVTSHDRHGVPNHRQHHFLFNHLFRYDIWDISCEIALRWIPLDLTDHEEKVVQLMASWCHQATSHYLLQC